MEIVRASQATPPANELAYQGRQIGFSFESIAPWKAAFSCREGPAGGGPVHSVFL